MPGMMGMMADPNMPMVGDRVKVVVPPHMPDHDEGVVCQVVGGALGIKFDAMPDVVHHWYVASEVMVTARGEPMGGKKGSGGGGGGDMADMGVRRLSFRLPEFPRVREYTGLWAILPSAAEALWAEAAAIDLAAHVRAAADSPVRVGTGYETVEAKGGKKVAVVRMTGPLMKGQMSLGGTSTVATRRALRQAAADRSVSSVLLAIDSPGGAVAGTADLAADVRAAAKRKPVMAHADDLTASAAYWVASQADEVWANTPTALVGSVGTILSVTESASRAERLGMRERSFVTGPLKDVGGDSPITAEQSAYLQSLVDRLQVEFDAAVRRGRRLSAEQMAEVRSGAIYPAADAKRLGLINGVRPLEATIEALASAK